MFVVASHDGVAPVHAVALVAEHWAHVPAARHAGWAAVGHGFVAPDALSPLHAEHVLVTGSHAGSVVGQRFDPGVQPTHRPAEHTGVAGGHAADAPLPALPLHWTHAPEKHTGNAPEHCADVVHG